MPLSPDSLQNHKFEGKIKQYERVLVDYLIDSGKAKSADPKLQLLLGYLGIHKILTQKQLRELTGYSLGSISKKLKFLIDESVVKKERIENTNENAYLIDERIYESTGNLSFTIFPEMKTYMEKKIEELKKYEGQRGQELLSSRLKEMIQALDLIQAIWIEIVKIFTPRKK